MSLTPAERALRAVRVHAPQLRCSGLAEWGRGLDNTAFRCDDVVVRVADAGTVGRERDLLAIVGTHVSLAVPVPLFADDELGVLAYPLLPGEPLLGRTPPIGAAHQLGAFLTELHAIPVSQVASLVATEAADPDDWLTDLTGPPHLLAALRDGAPPPGDRRVLAHADLGAEHLLADEDVVTGVLDWTDAAVTDPALDFARLLRDFGPGFLRSVLDAYDLEPPDAATTARIEFFARCAALEDLEFARVSGRTEYATAARAGLARLFPDLSPG